MAPNDEILAAKQREKQLQIRSEFLRELVDIIRDSNSGLVSQASRLRKLVIDEIERETKTSSGIFPEHVINAVEPEDVREMGGVTAAVVLAVHLGTTFEITSTTLTKPTSSTLSKPQVLDPSKLPSTETSSVEPLSNTVRLHHSGNHYEPYIDGKRVPTTGEKNLCFFASVAQVLSRCDKFASSTAEIVASNCGVRTAGSTRYDCSVRGLDVKHTPVSKQIDVKLTQLFKQTQEHLESVYDVDVLNKIFESLKQQGSDYLKGDAGVEFESCYQAIKEGQEDVPGALERLKQIIALEVSRSGEGLRLGIVISLLPTAEQKLDKLFSNRKEIADFNQVLPDNRPVREHIAACFSQMDDLKQKAYLEKNAGWINKNSALIGKLLGLRSQSSASSSAMFAFPREPLIVETNTYDKAHPPVSAR